MHQTSQRGMAVRDTVLRLRKIRHVGATQLPHRALAINVLDRLTDCVCSGPSLWMTAAAG